MVLREELQNIILLQNLDSNMLDRLEPHIQIARYREGDVVFREGDQPDRLYMIQTGKVLLEKKITEDVMVSLGAVKPGYSFGWSAIFENPYTVFAVCAEDSDILFVDNRQMITLMNDDHSMGYRMMQILSKIIKDRMDRMEEQFLRAIKENSDFEEIIDET